MVPPPPTMKERSELKRLWEEREKFFNSLKILKLNEKMFELDEKIIDDFNRKRGEEPQRKCSTPKVTVIEVTCY